MHIKYKNIMFLVNPLPHNEADPNLTVDDGCVVLGDASNIMTKRGWDLGRAEACTFAGSKIAS